MTENEAVETVDRAEMLATHLVRSLARVSLPHEAIVALGLAAGFVFANLEMEDGCTFESMLDDWILAVKAQYNEVRPVVEAERTKQ